MMPAATGFISRLEHCSNPDGIFSAAPVELRGSHDCGNVVLVAAAPADIAAPSSTRISAAAVPCCFRMRRSAASSNRLGPARTRALDPAVLHAPLGILRLRGEVSSRRQLTLSLRPLAAEDM